MSIPCNHTATADPIRCKINTKKKKHSAVTILPLTNSRGTSIVACEYSRLSFEKRRQTSRFARCTGSEWETAVFAGYVNWKGQWSRLGELDWIRQKYWVISPWVSKGDESALSQSGPGSIPVRCHMWVKFVVCSRLASEDFSPGTAYFLPPQKPNTTKTEDP